MKNKIYDLVIVGAGPAGMSAGIYAGRFRVKALVLSKDFGGTCNTAHLVENYPGYRSIGGMDLMMKFKEHLEDYKDQVGIKQEKVQGAIKKGNNFVLVTDKGEYETKSVLLSSGTQRKKLNIAGEKEFLGKGVSYCATCDAAFFKEKIVAVVGGSNSAVTAALLLAEHGRQVYLIYRKSEYDKAEPVWIERMRENKKIIEILNTNVLKIKGEGVVKSIELDKLYKDKNELNVDGVFIEIGSYPAMGLATNLGVKLDENDLIMVNEKGETNIEGVYAAGDVTNGFGNLKQIITAAASGAVTASEVYKWLTK